MSALLALLPCVVVVVGVLVLRVSGLIAAWLATVALRRTSFACFEACLAASAAAAAAFALERCSRTLFILAS